MIVLYVINIIVLCLAVYALWNSLDIRKKAELALDRLARTTEIVAGPPSCFTCGKPIQGIDLNEEGFTIQGSTERSYSWVLGSDGIKFYCEKCAAGMDSLRQDPLEISGEVLPPKEDPIARKELIQ